MAIGYSVSTATSTFLTMNELRAVTLAAQRVGMRLSELLEGAVDVWIARYEEQGAQEFAPLPDPPRMGVQLTLRHDAADALDRIRGAHYSRAVAVHDAVLLWLDMNAANHLAPTG